MKSNRFRKIHLLLSVIIILSVVKSSFAYQISDESDISVIKESYDAVVEINDSFTPKCINRSFKRNDISEFHDDLQRSYNLFGSKIDNNFRFPHYECLKINKSIKETPFSSISSKYTRVSSEGRYLNEVFVDDDFNSTTPGWQIDHFDKIQDGVDAVYDNGTVYVFAGNYDESTVVISHPVALIGENKHCTIFELDEFGFDQLLLLADGTTVQNFTIETWLGVGIKVFSNDNVIENILFPRLVPNGLSFGLYALNSSNTYINNCTLYDEIRIENCLNISITNCQFYNDKEWNLSSILLLMNSQYITIQNNWFESGGLYLIGSTLAQWNTHIILNNVIDDAPIYYYQDQHNFTIPIDAGQIICANCTNSTIRNNLIGKSIVGIQLAFSQNIEIVHNTLHSQDVLYFSNIIGLPVGLLLIESDDNTISHNIIKKFQTGIAFGWSDENKITNNQIHENLYSGFESWLSQNVYFGNNIVTNARVGTFLSDSKNFSIINNSFTESGLIIYGNTIEMTTTHIIHENIVNGKPIYYFKNLNQNIQVPPDAGQVILANCSEIIIQNIIFRNYVGIAIQIYYSTNITICSCTLNDNLYDIYTRSSSDIIISKSRIFDKIVFSHSSDNNIIVDNIFENYSSISFDYSSDNNIIEHSNFTKSLVSFLYSSSNNEIMNCTLYDSGILLRFSNNNTIQGCLIDYSPAGIYCYQSHSNLIKENRIINCGSGIRLYDSSINQIHNNTLRYNLDGVVLSRSDSNKISGNTLYFNIYYGIWSYSKNNTIYLNKLIYNDINAQDWGNNEWCHQNLRKGNYWSDYKGSDNNKDGIGDTPHNITPYDYNKDYFPLGYFAEDKFTLTIHTNGNGSVYRNPDDIGYLKGAIVELLAIADYGYIFDHWSEDSMGILNPATIEITRNTTITVFFRDILPPKIDIIKPANALYFKNKKIFTTKNPIVFGSIDITATASDKESGIDRVEFYIDGKLAYNDTSQPYIFSWINRTFSKHILKVVAYDEYENSKSQYLKIWKFF